MKKKTKVFIKMLAALTFLLKQLPVTPAEYYWNLMQALREHKLFSSAHIVGVSEWFLSTAQMLSHISAVTTGETGDNGSHMLHTVHLL